MNLQELPKAKNKVIYYFTILPFLRQKFPGISNKVMWTQVVSIISAGHHIMFSEGGHSSTERYYTAESYFTMSFAVETKRKQ